MFNIKHMDIFIYFQKRKEGERETWCTGGLASPEAAEHIVQKLDKIIESKNLMKNTLENVKY